MPENVNTSVLGGGIAAIAGSENDTRETMIKVDHVSMVFNMASEQLNSLKEYAIALAKGKLFFEGFTALDDVSFEVKKGDVFGVMGTNGSGKSTMLKIIAGVLDPTKGSCTINGGIAPLIELGAGFDMDLSARENIYLNGALLGYSKEFIDEHFDAIVEFAEVEKFLDMPLKNYSSGMVSRIAFAIATVIVPEILLVDEVLSVGDFMFQRKCENRIKELIEKHGVTVLIVSHSNEQIARLCNKAIWIEKGHTRLLGDAKQVARAYGGLGGRTGSPEAEQQIFNILSQPMDESKINSVVSVVAAENSNSLNAKLVSSTWGGQECNVACVACDNTHANAVLASALAGAYSAPVLSTKPTFLSDPVDSFLREKQPAKIFAFDCGGYGDGAFAELEALPWAPEVVRFQDRDDNTYAMSKAIIDYGRKEGLWGNELAVISCLDNPPAMLAMPYLYHNKVPVLMLYQCKVLNKVDDVKQFSAGEFQKVTLIGKRVAPMDELLRQQGFEVTALGAEGSTMPYVEIASFVVNAIGTENVSSVAFASDDQWADYLSAGCYQHGSTPLLLIDSGNLDNAAATLDFLHALAKGRDIKGVCIGDSAQLECTLVASALLAE